ncbi:hypothetical protein HPB47_011639 [Ixodes persulcatus]|uniref:Uncharacterized protein n=1 Tax=Ixodes persulcatus TaxID=34615 RepID=A0AC60NW46_IXOPE|nr:hypothetical protein HPB47_011639 [Ixodes persulcatus]
MNCVSVASFTYVRRESRVALRCSGDPGGRTHSSGLFGLRGQSQKTWVSEAVSSQYSQRLSFLGCVDGPAFIRWEGMRVFSKEAPEPLAACLAFDSLKCQGVDFFSFRLDWRSSVQMLYVVAVSAKAG